jgi:hypothetical protein
MPINDRLKLHYGEIVDSRFNIPGEISVNSCG